MNTVFNAHGNLINDFSRRSIDFNVLKGATNEIQGLGEVFYKTNRTIKHGSRSGAGSLGQDPGLGQG